MNRHHRMTRWSGLCGVAFTATVAFAVGCGGSGSSDSGGGGTTANTKSTSSIPRIDLSDLSLSEQSSSSNLAVGKGILSETQKESDFKSLFSRMGCEVNQRIEEIQRHGDQTNAILCHMQKAESKAGFKVGTDVFVYNVIAIPEPPPAVKEKIDAARKKDLKEFQKKSESDFDDEIEEDFEPEGKTMVIRAGNFNGNELRVDMAVRKPDGRGKRLMEATITADESAKQVNAVLIKHFPHGNKDEGARLDLVAKNVTISDGAISESANAVVDLTGQISGLFGAVRLEYAHDKTAATDKIRFIHDGDFKDFNRGVAHDFTAAMHAVQSATCGCGAGTFSGRVPAVPASDLLKHVPLANHSERITHIAKAEGLTGVTTSSKFCPGQSGLTLADGDTCSMSHTIDECYRISWSDIATDLGKKLKNRKYSVIAKSECSGPGSSNDAWSNLTSVDVNVAFTRDWDGSIPSGETPNVVDLSKLEPDDFKECMAYEERFRERKGCGAEACHEQGHRKAIENDAKDDGITLEATGNHENFNGETVEVKNEQSGSYTRSRCWNNATCEGQPISAQLVTRDQCKAVDGKGWGPDSSDCRAP